MESKESLIRSKAIGEAILQIMSLPTVFVTGNRHGHRWQARSAVDEESRKVQRLNKLVHLGLESHAIKIAGQKPGTAADITDEEVMSAVEALHPKKTLDTLPKYIPPHPNQFKRLLSDAPNDRGHFPLRDLVLSLNKAAAAGPSGWTAVMLRTWLNNKQCMTALSTIINLMINGQVPAIATEALRATRLHAFYKKPGTGDKSIRPIAIPEIFQKLAQQVFKEDMKRHANQHLAPEQLGVGIADGTTKARLFAQDELNKGRCLILVDVKNAFNEASRTRILEIVDQLPHEDFKVFIKWLYASPLPAHAISRDALKTIFSFEGVLQGAALSSFLFGILLQPALKEVEQSTGARPVAYLDDCGFGIDSNRIDTTLAQIERIFATFGLKINRSKTVIVRPGQNGRRAERIESEAQEERITRAQEGKYREQGENENENEDEQNAPPPPHDDINELEEAIYLGAPIYGLGVATPENTAFAQRWCEERFNEYKRDLQFTRNVQLDPSVLYTLTRLSSIARPPFYMRALKQDYHGPIKEYDEFILGNVWEALEIAEEGRAQAKLPITMGGLGLRQCSEFGPIPAYAALTDALQYVAKRGAEDGLSPAMQNYLNSITENTHLFLQRKGVVGISLADLRNRKRMCELMEDYAKEIHKKNTTLQAFLTSQVERVAHQTILANTDAAGQRRLTSVQSSDASFFLTHTDTITKEKQFINNLKMRLGLKLAANNSHPTCQAPCRNTHENIAKFPYHCLTSCPKKGDNTIFRHDLIKKSIAMLINKHGDAQAELEPPAGPESNRRPDVAIYADGQTYWLDITVINPACRSHVQQHNDLDETLARVEGLKTTKYRALAQQAQARFYPIVIDIYGVIGKKAHSFFKHYSKTHHPKKAAFIEMLFTSYLQRALATGNLRFVTHLLHRQAGHDEQPLLQQPAQNPPLPPQQLSPPSSPRYHLDENEAVDLSQYLDENEAVDLSL